ncbi:unnamed protein product [Camellia sinensis]
MISLSLTLALSLSHCLPSLHRSLRSRFFKLRSRDGFKPDLQRTQASPDLQTTQVCALRFFVIIYFDFWFNFCSSNYFCSSIYFILIFILFFKEHPSDFGLVYCDNIHLIFSLHLDQLIW